MAGNFNATRPFIYINGNVIDANQNNPNETTIYNAHNASMHELTGHEHTGAVGDGPKLTSSSIDLNANFNWLGIHTFLCGNLRIKGAGVGVVGLCYETSANNRTHVIPDSGANAIFLMDQGVQTVIGAKSFNVNTFLLGGAGTGKATIIYVNTATNRTHTVPLASGNDTFVMEAATQTLSNKTYQGGNVSADITANAGVKFDGVDVGTHTHNSNGATAIQSVTGSITFAGGAMPATGSFTAVIAAPSTSTAVQGRAACRRWRSDGGMNFNGNNYWQVTEGGAAYAAGNWTFTWNMETFGDGADFWTLDFEGTGFVFNSSATSAPL